MDEPISRLTLPLSCACGHMGAISKVTSKANETMYWEIYTSHYLICKKEFFTRSKSNFIEVMKKIRPSCPECYKDISLFQLRPSVN